MDSSVKVPRTYTDLTLDQLKIMFGDRLSPRRLTCVETKYDLLKYLWKECQIDECYLEKYQINNRDDIATYNDAFSRHLLDVTNQDYTGQNEYARQRLADRIQPIAQENSRHREDEKSSERFAGKKFKIKDHIRSKISGKKWWQFGKNLDVIHGTLDTINREQNEVARKIDEVFEEYERGCSSDAFSYVDKVRNALIKSKLEDLARDVCRIMEG